MKTRQYLDELKRELGLPSDYALAKRLGIHQATMSNYRNGKRAFDATMCMRVAELLDIDPLRVIVDCEAERAARPDVRKMWEGLARRLAACIVGALGAGLLASPPQAQAEPNVAAAVYYVKRRRALFPLFPPFTWPPL